MYQPLKMSQPHPQFFEMLFAHKAPVLKVFKDILGLHGIAHMALARIDSEQKILVFSSTPSLEFNLFTGSLWQKDNTYAPAWYRQNSLAFWEHLYQDAYYDELYYECQIKYHLPLGFSMASEDQGMSYICSLAFAKDNPETRALLEEKQAHFHQMQLYCQQWLGPLFLESSSIRPC